MADQTEPENKSFGEIDITPHAIASIVSHAVNQCYGVVGMANKSLVNGIAQLLSRETNKGIAVNITPDELSIDVYVIVEFGIRVRAVAETVQSSVKFSVEQALGRQVNAVNVYVQGLRHAPK